MESMVWRLLRWVVALGMCALVVVFGAPMAIDAVMGSIVIGDDVEDEGREADGAEEESAGEVPSGPVSDGKAEPDADFAVRDGTVDQTSATELSLRGDRHLAVLRFPLIEGEPACVATAELGMDLLEADRTEVAAYAGLAREFEDGEEADDPRRDDTVHAKALTDGSPGRLVWDVTDLYRDWADGDLSAPGTPFVVVVAATRESARLVLAASESDEHDPPALVWEGTSDCGGSGA